MVGIDPAAIHCGVPVGCANPGICPPGIVVIWPVISIADRAVIPSVGLRIDHAKACGRPDEVAVERLVDIESVIPVYIPDMVAVIPKGIIVHPHPAEPVHSSVPVGNVDVSDSPDPAIIVIKDRHMLNLYDSSEVVILHIGVIVESSIEGQGCSACGYTDQAIDIEIKLPIRIYRKGDAAFLKDKRI